MLTVTNSEHRRQQNREAQRRYRAKNSERVRELERKRYEDNPEPRRAACKKWRAAHPERQAAADRAWLLNNREAANARALRWMNANREAVRAKNQARKIKRRARITKILMEAQKGRCAYCRLKLGEAFHIDHIIPRKLGGSNEHSNLQLTCVDCNFKKAAKHPIAFARSRGLLL